MKIPLQHALFLLHFLQNTKNKKRLCISNFNSKTSSTTAKKHLSYSLWCERFGSEWWRRAMCSHQLIQFTNNLPQIAAFCPDQVHRVTLQILRAIDPFRTLFTYLYPVRTERQNSAKSVHRAAMNSQNASEWAKCRWNRRSDDGEAKQQGQLRSGYSSPLNNLLIAISLGIWTLLGFKGSIYIFKQNYIEYVVHRMATGLLPHHFQA